MAPSTAVLSATLDPVRPGQSEQPDAKPYGEGLALAIEAFGEGGGGAFEAIAILELIQKPRLHGEEAGQAKRGVDEPPLLRRPPQKPDPMATPLTHKPVAQFSTFFS
jgi:hypothetical protein